MVNKTVSMFDRLNGLPFSDVIFNTILRFKAPYFSTIKPRIRELREGLCSLEMKDRRAVHNHIGSIHAIALCNLCELTMGLAVDATLPSNLRWIAKSMNINYQKIAHGKLTSACRLSASQLKKGDVAIPVEINDEKGNRVVSAAITIYVSERPAA